MTTMPPIRTAAKAARATISALVKPVPKQPAKRKAKKKQKQRPKQSPEHTHNTRSKRLRSSSVSSNGSSVVEVEPPDPIAAVRVKMQRLETTLAALQGKVDRNTTVNETLRADNADLSKKVKEITTDNGVLRGMVDRACGENAELKESMSKIANASTLLNGSVRMTIDEIAGIKASVQKAHQDFATLNDTLQKTASLPSQADPSIDFRLKNLEAQVHGLKSTPATMRG